MVECPRCDKKWAGTRTCHCTACHETFIGYTAFDLHRDGSHTGGRFCVTPTKAGLVDASRAYPCWTIPNLDEPEEDGQL